MPTDKALRLQMDLARACRHRPNEDHTTLRQDYKAQRLADHIHEVVDAAPPLRPEQRERLARILRGGA